ncbi:MAG: DUF262 domain-containing protein [Nitrospirae bacterium]|nr:DUF262 domain-containing protein [Nitrospirota bacterium]
MKIESHDQNIGTLLSSGYYRIPRFQRPYSWEHEHIQDFWNDIIQDAPSDCFIGSMVVYEFGKQHFGVVDGQQRLTTITILLCVLRNTLDSLGFKNLAHGVNGLIERKNINNQDEFILTTETSYPYFQDHIQKWGKPDVSITPLDEEKNLKSAYQKLEELVSGAVKSIESDTTLSSVKIKQKIENSLVAIRDALLDLKIILVMLDNEDDAYIIFETLNTRGKDLSLTDLVKNHLTKHLKAKSASVDQTKIKWEKILETIEGSSEDLDTDSFIHHFWLSKYDYLPSKKLFKVLKKTITKAQAKDFLNELYRNAVFYRAIHETSFDKWAKDQKRIREALDALMLFKVRQQTPCVLSLVRAFKDGKIKQNHLEEALVAVEKFHFLFTATTSQRSSGGISGMYAALGRRISESKKSDDAYRVIRDLKKKLRSRVPSLDEVKAVFSDIIYTNKFSKNRKLMRYMLINFDRQINTGVTIDYDHMTIEHLLPQSVIGSDGFTDSTIGQIGNLILVSEKLNAKLKGKSFIEKKRVLIAEKFILEPELSVATTWSVNDIINRSKHLAEVAYNKVWKI